MYIFLCCLIAYILVTPFFYLKAVKFGMKIVSEPAKAVEEPIFHIPEKKEPLKVTEEQDRILQILTNIDKYQGDSKGQKKVEVKHD